MTLLTSLEVYPLSMVATRDIDVSHMWPTTAVVAVVAILQTAVAMLVRPASTRWLRRRRVWKTVIGVNAAILTIFIWHMTAKVAVIGAYESIGFELIGEPSVVWWLQRPCGCSPPR